MKNNNNEVLSKCASLSGSWHAMWVYIKWPFLLRILNIVFKQSRYEVLPQLSDTLQYIILVFRPPVNFVKNLQKTYILLLYTIYYYTIYYWRMHICFQHKLFLRASYFKRNLMCFLALSVVFGNVTLIASLN